MFPILQIGPLAIQVPGLVLILALWIGLSIMEKNAGKHKVKADVLYNLVFSGLVAGAIGARLTYAGRFPAAFAQSPLSLISLNPGLLDPVGGLASALIGAFIYGQRKKLSLWPTLDALTPVFGALAIALPFANLASGRGFGAETSLPWGIEIWGAVRHPTQFYETAAAIFVFTFIWPKMTRPGKGTNPGSVFLQFVILIAALKLFLEGFRGDSVTVLNGLRTAQIAAWLVLAIALLELYRRTAVRNR